MSTVLDLMYGIIMCCLFCLATYISVLSYRSKQYRDAILVELCALLCLAVAYNALKGVLP